MSVPVTSRRDRAIVMLLRALAVLLGMEGKKFDALVERYQSMTPEEQRAEMLAKLDEAKESLK